LARLDPHPALENLSVTAPTLTTTHQKVVATLLSAPRLMPYLRAANGNLRLALKLYQWNVEIDHWASARS
jgi:hypothetical protein